MKETQAYLRKRWDSNQNASYTTIITLLHNGKNLDPQKLDSTNDGLIDLRGFSAPKKYQTEKSNRGNIKRYVSEGIRIKKIDFIGVDFSYSDFERCLFLNCTFQKCTFKSARFWGTEFWGCQFQDMVLERTNLGHSSFTPSGIFLQSEKDSFKNVAFKQVNLSRVHAFRQHFENCQFTDCRTGEFHLNECKIDSMRFSGTVKNLFIKNSKKIVGLDFSDSTLNGFKLEKQALSDFQFPSGDSYYQFSNKSSELSNLASQGFASKEESNLFHILEQIWFQNGLEADFVDINWLDEEEKAIGKRIISRLKAQGNR